jgi:hypothetical protein
MKKKYSKRYKNLVSSRKESNFETLGDAIVKVKKN